MRSRSSSASSGPVRSRIAPSRVDEERDRVGDDGQLVGEAELGIPQQLVA